ncbi:hypothetical protein [Alteromonas sp. KUL49]|uniref:hypothetical protein n=1 Tax=Alteromonas sp. KUL49 TaxID=2480798 RepID=UPI00102ED8B0|nr:hypothetical protein [Alteromonas sp. KUL49]TAP38586.1 hypothetical protein EYS00_14330 [Alteromonas sp. KUL49]GEA12520.1 hypothetical protein KUL49_28950 [Alteromonas sp. KUL49]
MTYNVANWHKKYVTLVLITFLSTVSFADTLDVAKDASYSETRACTENFHGVPIAPDAKYCQSFDGNQPVSLVYFSPNPVTEVVSFYRDTGGNYTETTTVQSRIVLTPSDANHRLIVSQDNTGTQVDILVFN